MCHRNSNPRKLVNTVSASHRQTAGLWRRPTAEIDRLETKHKASKYVAELKPKVYELGEKLEKTTKENELLHQELVVTKKKLSLSQLYKKHLSGTRPSKNVRN